MIKGTFATRGKSLRRGLILGFSLWASTQAIASTSHGGCVYSISITSWLDREYIVGELPSTGTFDVNFTSQPRIDYPATTTCFSSDAFQVFDVIIQPGNILLGQVTAYADQRNYPSRGFKFYGWQRLAVPSLPIGEYTITTSSHTGADSSPTGQRLTIKPIPTTPVDSSIKRRKRVRPVINYLLMD